jgi:hypothetical protein
MLYRFSASRTNSTSVMFWLLYCILLTFSTLVAGSPVVIPRDYSGSGTSCNGKGGEQRGRVYYCSEHDFNGKCGWAKPEQCVSVASGESIKSVGPGTCSPPAAA